MVVNNTAGTVTGYLNGSNAGWLNGGGGPAGNTFLAGTDLSNSNPLTLGIRTDAGVEFRGGIDDVAIWNRALASNEIAAIHRAGLAGRGLDSSLDSDGDGLPDGWETEYGLAPNNPNDAASDEEGDGLTNLQEFQNGTHPRQNDTDDDGLNDGAEVNTHQTNPTMADTDGDGLADGAEVNTHSTNPLVADTDGDELSDGAEVNTHGTLPLDPDTDDDGFSDGLEVLAGSNPTVGTDIPAFDLGDSLMIYFPFNFEEVLDPDVLDRAGSPGGPFNALMRNGGPTLTAGLFEDGLEFAGGPNDGDYPYLDLSAHATNLARLAEGTVAAWVRIPNEGLTTDTLAIFAVSDRDDASSEARLWVSNTGTLNYGVRNDNVALGTVSSGSVNPLLDGEWHHVAVTLSNGTARLYIDGRGAGAGASTFAAGVSEVDTAGIGRNLDNTPGGGQWFFDGFMDDWALWSRPLSAAEILYLYSEGQMGRSAVPPTFDRDDDGLPDDWEVRYNFNANDPSDAALDSDDDGLSNLEEFQRATHPRESDTDGDGLSDGSEVNLHQTDPTLSDTDDDGLEDGAEVDTHHTNPTVADTDGDGLGDGLEVNTYGTSPLKTDTDGDGFSDSFEVLAGTDPTVATDRPTFDFGQGLVMYFPFNAGDVSDSNFLDRAEAPGGPFNGLVQNDGPIPALGIIDAGVEFTGGPNNGDYPYLDLSAHATNLAGLAEGTVAAWVRVPNDGLTTDVLTIFAVSDRDDASSEVRMWVSNGGTTGTGTLAYGVRNDGQGLGTIFTGSVNPLLDGEWHHVAVTVSNGTARLYLDGALAGSGASVFCAGVSEVDTAGIGRNLDNTAGGGQWFFDGFMDDWALWSRPLSAVEILYLHDQGRLGRSALVQEPDTDGDGMPDSYEDANGLDKNADDASGDLDGDGMNNLAEYRAGTGANDPASNLRVTGLLGNPLELTIVWSSVPGKVYAVEASPDLSPGSWQVLPGADNLNASSGPTTNFEDTSSTGSGQRFFRVRVVR